MEKFITCGFGGYGAQTTLLLPVNCNSGPVNFYDFPYFVRVSHISTKPYIETSLAIFIEMTSLIRFAFENTYISGYYTSKQRKQTSRPERSILRTKIEILEAKCITAGCGVEKVEALAKKKVPNRPKPARN